jgi:hypothetical protein
MRGRGVGHEDRHPVPACFPGPSPGWGARTGVQSRAPDPFPDVRSTPDGGGIWTNASSRELKEGIAPLDAEAALAALAKLEPVSFHYRVEPGDPRVLRAGVAKARGRRTRSRRSGRGQFESPSDDETGGCNASQSVSGLWRCCPAPAGGMGSCCGSGAGAVDARRILGERAAAGPRRDAHR